MVSLSFWLVTNSGVVFMKYKVALSSLTKLAVFGRQLKQECEKAEQTNHMISRKKNYTTFLTDVKPRRLVYNTTAVASLNPQVLRQSI